MHTWKLQVGLFLQLSLFHFLSNYGFFAEFQVIEPIGTNYGKRAPSWFHADWDNKFLVFINAVNPALTNEWHNPIVCIADHDICLRQRRFPYFFQSAKLILDCRPRVKQHLHFFFLPNLPLEIKENFDCYHFENSRKKVFKA